jgi:hypothetical protein
VEKVGLRRVGVLHRRIWRLERGVTSFHCVDIAPTRFESGQPEVHMHVGAVLMQMRCCGKGRVEKGGCASPSHLARLTRHDELSLH